MSALPTLPDGGEQAVIDQTITSILGRPGALLGILEAIQEHHPHKFLLAEALRYVAAKLDIPLARIYSFATFYVLFNLGPQGDHTVCICRGTACHARNSRNLLESLRLEEGMLNRVSAVVRAYDPCLSCSTHATGMPEVSVSLIGADGTVLDEICS